MTEIELGKELGFTLHDIMQSKIEYAKSLVDISTPYLSPREKRLNQKKHYEEYQEQLLASRVMWTDMVRRSTGVRRQYCLHYLRDNEKELEKIRRRINFLSMTKKDAKSMDIARAKEIPIDSIYEVLPNGFFVNNPLRTERSPSNSFFLYRNNNKWHDFATGEGGDILDLIMKERKCTLVEAYNSLIH